MDPGPTFMEGWWAYVMGWRLHADATESYRRGWLAAQRAHEGLDKSGFAYILAAGGERVDEHG